jgi:hypothetical protein
MAAKADNSVDIMMLFINTDWRFENKRILNVIQMLSPEERTEFDCDCRNIIWQKYITLYVKGIAIWNLHEDAVEPVHNFE